MMGAVAVFSVGRVGTRVVRLPSAVTLRPRLRINLMSPEESSGRSGVAMREVRRVDAVDLSRIQFAVTIIYRFWAYAGRVDETANY